MVSGEPKQDSLEQRIATALTKISLALKLEAWGAAGQRGLSATQSQILAMLLSEKNGLRPSIIADRLVVKQPTITESLRPLVEKGLVEKRVDPLDARATLVVLTRAGVAEAKKARGWPDFLVGVIDVLSEREREVFFQSLVKMVGTLQDQGHIPTNRMCISCQHFKPWAHRGAKPHHCSLLDAPIANSELRIDCEEYVEAPEALHAETWKQFLARSDVG